MRQAVHTGDDGVSPSSPLWGFLWLLYVIRQAIIFLPCGFFFYLSFFFFFLT